MNWKWIVSAILCVGLLCCFCSFASAGYVYIDGKPVWVMDDSSLHPGYNVIDGQMHWVMKSSKFRGGSTGGWNTQVVTRSYGSSGGYSYNSSGGYSYGSSGGTPTPTQVTALPRPKEIIQKLKSLLNRRSNQSAVPIEIIDEVETSAPVGCDCPNCKCNCPDCTCNKRRQVSTPVTSPPK